MAINYWQEFEEEQIYHFYNRANGKRILFMEERDYFKFLEIVKKYLSSYIDFYSYCLIPNHFHFLIRVRSLSSNVLESLQAERTNSSNLLLKGIISFNRFLEDQLRRLFSSYALYFNHKYGQRGTLFQKRPKRVILSSIERVLYQVCYIHHNPIHHNLSRDYYSWKYSSYNCFFSTKESLIKRSEVLDWFGDGDTAIGKKLFIQWHKGFKIDYENGDELNY